MASTAFVIPQTGTGTGWTNPSNLTTDSDATYANKSFSISETSDQLVGTNYNFSGIPAGATIDGIEVEVRLDTSFAGFTENQIQLIKDGTLQGSNKSTSASISTSWATMTYGGATDKWGWTAVTLADIQDSGFGLACKWTAPSVNAKQMYVNTYRIKIYYTETATVEWGAATFNLAMTNSVDATVTASGSTDTGWLNPTSVAVGGSGTAWVNPSYIMAHDTSNAYVPLSNFNNSEIIYAYDFDFSAIGSGDTINGIEVQIERQGSSSTNLLDYSVYLYAGGTQKGNNKADLVTLYPTSDTYAQYGSPTDHWGWSGGIGYSDLATIRVGFQADINVSVGRTAYCNHIQMRVHYTSAGGDEHNMFLKLGAF